MATLKLKSIEKFCSYSEEAGELIIKLLRDQKIPVVAWNNGYIYVEVNGFEWTISDNCGELHAHKVNTSESFDVPLDRANILMPGDVRQFAFMITVWLLDGFHGRTSNFFWTPLPQDVEWIA